MNIPSDLHYTKSHEWLRVEGDEGVVGLTDFAQGELGDIVYVNLPEVGDPVRQGEAFGAIEAVKAASDLYAPASGEVIAVNGLLDQAPDLINKSPYTDGWVIKIKIADKGEVDTLLTPDQYVKIAEHHG